MDQKTNQPITSLAEQDKLPLLVRFHRSLYRITEPDSTWFQRSLAGPPECGRCDDTLTFCFAPRIDPDPHIADLARSYQTPVAIRCNCFLTEPASAVVPVYHRALARQPVAIVAF
jgi:hypothetical protein